MDFEEIEAVAIKKKMKESLHTKKLSHPKRVTQL